MPETFTPTNEWLYRHIVEDSSTAVIYGDANGVIRLWNRGAEEIFGWTAEEALGRSMELIIPEKHRTSQSSISEAPVLFLEGPDTLWAKIEARSIVWQQPGQQPRH
jgi:PAS domain-containing protein